MFVLLTFMLHLYFCSEFRLVPSCAFFHCDALIVRHIYSL
jgi:hypothetical protein